MIFYFTGTGNSKYVADAVAKAQNDCAISVAEAIHDQKDVEVTLKKDDLLGFVYPVHAWGAPLILMDFIDRLSCQGEHAYIFLIATCGDEQGYASRTLEKKIVSKGLHVDASFALAMPNNFVRGFDVDGPALEQKKLQKAGPKMGMINERITKREKGVFEPRVGKLAALKSGFIRPLFQKFGRSTKCFTVLSNCTQCLDCVKICPIQAIMLQPKPIWHKKTCTQCMGCINVCKPKAIQCGKSTIKRGRYLHPDYKDKFS